ncbi:MAG: Cyclomaltodextrinase [Bacteroidetes bacterium]|nr:Cyclomaltodextrinase [Bacteroidota bacterium]
MKRLYFLLFAFAIGCQCLHAFEVKRVEPQNWWAGMQDSILQVMIYGKNVASAKVYVSSSDIRISKLVPMENPNYLFLYLNIGSATPQKFNINLTVGRQKKTISYELRQREEFSRNRESFTSGDVIYLLMPDRFANGNPANDAVKGMLDTKVDRSNPYARHGGDLSGLTSHLDYIADLGATAIWLTPFNENNMKEGSYHGYAITDYYKADPRLGTNEEYASMVRKAHETGLKVIMDMVFNHCGSEHFFFKDRPSHDWFNNPDGYVQTSFRTTSQYDPYASNFDKKASDDGWFVESMPDLNQRNPHLAKYLIQNSIWWIEYAGIDGIRQDTYPYADYDMMSNWCKTVTTEYPKFNIVGEVWYGSNIGTSFWQKDSKLAFPRNSNLPSVMDFPLFLEFSRSFGDSIDFQKIYELLGQDIVYANPLNVLTFLDNHDTSRFLKNAKDVSDFDRYRLALTLLLTTRGIPQLYYGDEIGMFGDKKDGDGALRPDFPGGWPTDSQNAFTRGGRTAEQNKFFDLERKLLHFRKGHEAIAKGSLKHFAPERGVYVYERQYGNRSVVVFLNGSGSKQVLNVANYREILPAEEAEDVLSGRKIPLTDTIEIGGKDVYLFGF